MTAESGALQNELATLHIYKAKFSAFCSAKFNRENVKFCVSSSYAT